MKHDGHEDFERPFQSQGTFQGSSDFFLALLNIIKVVEEERKRIARKVDGSNATLV